MKTYGFNAVNAYGFGSNQGFGFAPSQYIIQYLSSGGTFTFSTDATAMELTNYGSGSNGLSYAGAGLELGATNDLPLDVNYDLDTELMTNADCSSKTGWSVSGVQSWSTDGTAFTINTSASGDTSLRQVKTDLAGTGQYVEIVIDALPTTGTLYFRVGSALTLNIKSVQLSVGTNIIDGFTIPSNHTDTYFYIISEDMASGESFEVSTFSVKSVTTTGYLTYATDTEVVQVGNAMDGGE